MNTRTKAVAAGATILVLGGLGTSAVVASATGADVNPLNNGNLDKAEQAALDHVGGGTVTEAETEDDGGREAYDVEITRGDGSEVDVELGADYAVLRAARDDNDDDNDGSDADDRALTASERNRAGQAALGEVGSGTVTEVSAEDDVINGANAAYEVEVTSRNRTEVDVYLDARFTVVATIEDLDEANDRDDD